MENQIQHHGIKGQRWGVRRFQSSDGSLTPAGKKRYKSMSDDAKEALELKKKKIKDMSNSDLRKLNERQQLENAHRKLNPSSVNKAIITASTIAASLGTIATLYSKGSKIIDIGKKYVNSFMYDHRMLKYSKIASTFHLV